ncbi:MAG: hypothetical protein NUV92_04075 [Ignavibacteria bacterium]|jgi:2'-5' RNA ligase|nr:hypothetical protein [Ignavibacteria bacterium]MDH7526680.1 hypothetical protein [Ignavibacteria bacterium]
MEIPEAKGYSIWLLFEKDVEELLQSLINQLSFVTNSPTFIPHLTLISGLTGNEENLFEQFEIFSSKVNSFFVSSKKVDISDSFYRSLFIEIEKNDELGKIYDYASSIFKVKNNYEKFFPHISLLYSFEKDEAKKNLIDKYLENLPAALLINRIGICRTEGKPSEWTLLKVMRLN